MSSLWSGQRRPIAAVAMASAAPERPRLLFIEDNTQLLDLYSLVLDDDFEVVRATRGEDAYRLACCESIHAVIADVL